MTSTDAYYWAGGRQVPLSADHHLAVNQNAANDHGLWNGELSAVAEAAGTDIGHGLVVLPGNSVSEQLRDHLDQSGASAPVYRSGDSLIVVLPEVRMEATPGEGAAKVRTVIEANDASAAVEEPTPGRFHVTPSSGRGADALILANKVAEEADPQAAQARFLRISPQQSDAGEEVQ